MTDAARIRRRVRRLFAFIPAMGGVPDWIPHRETRPPSRRPDPGILDVLRRHARTRRERMLRDALDAALDTALSRCRAIGEEASR
jgi:hypothetical protein